MTSSAGRSQNLEVNPSVMTSSAGRSQNLEVNPCVMDLQALCEQPGTSDLFVLMTETSVGSAHVQEERRRPLLQIYKVYVFVLIVFPFLFLFFGIYLLLFGLKTSLFWFVVFVGGEELTSGCRADCGKGFNLSENMRLHCS